MKRINLFALFITFCFVSNFGVSCYADTITEEITVKYNFANKYVPNFQLPGNPKVRYALKPKGGRKVGDDEIVIDWMEYFREHLGEGVPNGFSVRAACVSVGSVPLRSMVKLSGAGRASVTELRCDKGQGLSVIVLDPKREDYEYVADLIITRDDDAREASPRSVVVDAVGISLPLGGAAATPSMMPPARLPTAAYIVGGGSGI